MAHIRQSIRDNAVTAVTGLKKLRKRTTPKQRDPSWKLRHALGHKVEASPKAYTRKPKHPKTPNE